MKLFSKITAEFFKKNNLTITRTADTLVYVG